MSHQKMCHHPWTNGNSYGDDAWLKVDPCLREDDGWLVFEHAISLGSLKKMMRGGGLRIGSFTIEWLFATVGNGTFCYA